jgi:peptidoglycan/xylan/chitin deacetylase (PgdA/CDA1 family)
MSLKKRILTAVYQSGAFAPFHWVNRQKLLILTYHRFSPHKEINKLSSDEFASHLEYLKKYTNVISLSEATESLAKKKTLPPNATVITVDDGYHDAFDVALPLLNSFEFPATLYAVADFIDGKCWLWTDFMRFVLLNTKCSSLAVQIEDVAKIDEKLAGVKERTELADRVNSILKRLPNARRQTQIKQISDLLKVDVPAAPTAEYAPITWQQAREMEGHNFQIESHTTTHPILTSVDQFDLDYELRNSKERLEKALNKTVNHFCYPNGNFNEVVKQAVKDAGYQSAVTTHYGFNGNNADRFSLKRVGGPFAVENFAQSVSGFEAAKMTFTSPKQSA